MSEFSVGDYVRITADVQFIEDSMSRRMKEADAVGIVESVSEPNPATGNSFIGVYFQSRVSEIYRHFLSYELELVDLAELADAEYLKIFPEDADLYGENVRREG